MGEVRCLAREVNEPLIQAALISGEAISCRGLDFHDFDMPNGQDRLGHA